MNFKLLQWNIWAKENIDNIIEVLCDIGADILCLQEVYDICGVYSATSQCNLIKEKLKMNYYFHAPQKGNCFSEPQQGNAIFSKFTILNNRPFFIKFNANASSNAYSKNRAYIEADIDILGHQLKVGTTHMSFSNYFINNNAKKEETKNLMNILSKRKKRFIFAGDLNTRPYSLTIKSITQHLKNCGPNIKKKTWTTKPFKYHGFVETDLRWRLDYVFCSKDLIVRNSKIIYTPYSDHLPILVEFEI